MTVLLDENLPHLFEKELHGHAVESVSSMGWLGIKNGSLMKLIAKGGFQVFLTADKNIVYQQSTANLPFAFVELSTNHWPLLLENMDAIRDAVGKAEVGRVVKVSCGNFLPERKRKVQQEQAKRTQRDPETHELTACTNVRQTRNLCRPRQRTAITA